MTTNDPAQRSELGSKVDRLETSTRRLTAEIDRLGNTLTRVREIEDEQVELREQTTLAMLSALDAADSAAANQSRLTTMHLEATTRDNRRRFAIRALSMLMLLLLPVVAAIIYAVVLTRVDGLAQRQRTDLLRGCNIRNQIIELNIKRENDLAQTVTDPVEKQIHLDSAATYKPLVIDCDSAYTNFSNATGDGRKAS